MTQATHPDARLNPETLLTKIHPAVMDMPMLGEADLRALAESIINHGVMKPITLSHDGFIVDGRNRCVAALRAGLSSVPVIYLGSKVDLAAYALESAVTGRNLTRSGIVLMLYLKHPDLAEMRGERTGGRPPKEKGQETGDNYHRFPGKGCESFATISEKYNVPKEYFTRLAHIHEQCDAEAWEAVQRSILDRESSIPALVAGLAGKADTAGKKRKDPLYHKLACKAPISLENAFKNWANIPWAEEFSREAAVESFGKALAVAPSEIRDVEEATIIAIWPEHERLSLLKKLTSWNKARLKQQKADKAKHHRR